jgi:hypothetical protein
MSAYSNDILYWSLVGGVVGVAAGAVIGRPAVGAVSGAIAGGAILPFAFGYSPPKRVVTEDATGELPDLGERVHRVRLGWGK